MPKGTYWADVVLNQLNSIALFIALSSTSITASGSGITEPVGNGYSRCTVPLNSWAPAAGGNIANLVPFTFNPATGLWLGGANITWFALLDGSSNLYYYNQIPLAYQRSFHSGDVPSFSTGVLVVSEI
jgi:hypothetical protein